MTQDLLINSTARRIRCVAGPGTGKTWAMKQKVLRLLNGNQGNLPQIFAVTYTRLAAEQLKTELCSPDTPNQDNISASTLHSFAFKVLQQEHAIEALGRHPRPCMQTELKVLKHDLASDFGGVREVNRKLNAFSSMWARLQNEEVGWPHNPEDKQFHEAYLKWMRFHKCICIDELISLVVTYLRDNPINDVTNMFQHIVVDEYQDLNKADQTFIDLLGINSNLLVVGDDDQSIYSFRHANPEGIREWYNTQQDPKEDIQLNICRRCDGKIISLANHLINKNNNRLRTDLTPLPERADLGDINIVQWETRQSETTGLAEGIKKMLQQNLIPDGDSIIVLVPRKEFGQNLMEKLNEIGVTDVSLKTSPNWDSNEIGEKLSLAYLYEDRNDLVSLRYWLGLGDPNWHRNKYRILFEYCIANSITPNMVLTNALLCNQLQISVLHEKYNDLLNQLGRLENKSIDEVLDILFPLQGETETIGRIIRDFKENSTDEFSFRKTIIEAILSKPEDPIETKIKIMTLHGAKGLTCHTVIVAGLVNGILPTIPNATGEDIRILEEERRLLFVAITRAKKRVVLSSFRKVTRQENRTLRLGLNGNNFYLTTQASAFLSELGPTRPTTITGDNWLNLMNN